MTLLAPFLDHCARTPDAAALVSGTGERVSFAALDRRSSGLAAAFRARGIGDGDRVLIALPLSPKLYAVLIALWKIGAVAVAPDASAGLKGLAHAVRTTQPKAYAGPRWLGLLCRLLPGQPALGSKLPSVAPVALDDPAQTVPDDHPALISFTSGSTGTPKTILRTHGFLSAQLAALTPLLQMADGPALVSLPMFVLALLGLGQTSILPPGSMRRPDSINVHRWRAHLLRTGATRLLAPPAICNRLADADALRGLAWIGTGGGPIFPQDLRHLQARAPTAEIICVYGSTEAEPIAHLRTADIRAEDWERMMGGYGLLAGAPVPDIRVRLINDAILVTGPHVNKRYLDAVAPLSDKHEIDGEVWHATGDAGRIDDQGRLWLLGRCAGRVGAYFPFAVEIGALGWSGVRQAALVGMAGKPILAVAGDRGFEAMWRVKLADQFPDIELCFLKKIPLDRRHNSKIDYPALYKLLLRPQK
jgi:acyl-coenzyme A synthetase/AMP-(fatty) acid ligase